MSTEGWYYLHVNGELIFKRELGTTAADIRDSDLARGMWPMDIGDREGAWRLLVEAGAAGAKPERIKELAAKWQCDDADAAIFAKRIGLTLDLDGDNYFARRADFVNLQESPSGFGKTSLEAMIELGKALGYTPSKMWGASFADLVNAKAAA